MKDEKVVYIKDFSNYVGQKVSVQGWVYNLRKSGAIIFLQIRDGSGFTQSVVVKDDVKPQVFADANEIQIETSLVCTGIVKSEKRAPTGFELTVKDLKLLSVPQEEYPIGKKDHGPDFLLSNRHLWLRSKRQWAILRIRNRIISAIKEFLQQNNFLRIDAPMITPSACEGTTTLFDIDYFGEKAYLSQSGQLYLEAAIYSFGRCYDFGPILRAEKSKTRRHLIEFWMMDAEAAFVDFEENINIQERLIQFVINNVITSCQEEFQILERDTNPLKNIVLPFPRLTYDETIQKLQELGSDIQYGTDFGNDDETILMNYYKQPLFVTKYPASFKAFYFMKDKVKPELALAADLLAPEGYGEIIGGGQREDKYKTLLLEIKNHGYNIDDYAWYLDLRKYGSVTHSGFGLGLERIVAWICKLDHVRESIPFPRLLDRFRP